MDEKLIAVWVGLISGAVGYWFSTFWMQPILRYRELRGKTMAALIFYAQVVNADGLNERMQNLYGERVYEIRKLSSALQACIFELPCWYLMWQRLQKRFPLQAAQLLIGLSNTTDFDLAARLVEIIRRKLGIPGEPD